MAVKRIGLAFICKHRTSALYRNHQYRDTTIFIIVLALITMPDEPPRSRIRRAPAEFIQEPIVRLLGVKKQRAATATPTAEKGRGGARRKRAATTVEEEEASIES